jgi:hypothetical protein
MFVGELAELEFVYSLAAIPVLRRRDSQVR